MTRAAALVAALLLPPVLAGAASDAVTETENSFQNVVVRPGDTLWSISHTYLKDPSKWDEILKYNRLPTADPTVALPGMTLRVPVRLIKTSLRAAHLVYAVNKVLVRRKERPDWKDSKPAMELFRGDTLRTLDDSRARVKFLDKELVNLESNSMAVIKPEEDSDVVLKSGAVFAGHARVVTASASITPRTKDTRYSARVEADLTTKVEVYKGLAAVDAQGSRVEVPAGMETRVAPGLAPEVPRPLTEETALEARAAEFDSAVAVGGGAAPRPRADLAAPTVEADAASLRGDIDALHVGLPIQGYHVQAARDREFRAVLFDRKYDTDQKFYPTDANLAPGAYWWRVAIIDLLGTEGNYSEARYFSVGIKRAERETSETLSRMLTIVSPAEGQYVDADHVVFAGVLRDDRLRLEVQGRSARIDQDGNWSVEVSLKEGPNQIELAVSDGKGNVTRQVRRVNRR
ncbi:MAG: LysM peptidoglycan-binding domain-containing protein [Elusimicrobia bacterium]|nr:LysM peptidoglycan-binding domain-containing protein [Elusimicrobiota bacterium]